MPRIAKPTVRKGPADRYAMTGETIVEFHEGSSGGLISVWRNPTTGRLTVTVYRTDDDVDVLGPDARPGT